MDTSHGKVTFGETGKLSGTETVALKSYRQCQPIQHHVFLFWYIAALLRSESARAFNRVWVLYVKTSREQKQSGDVMYEGVVISHNN